MVEERDSSKRPRTGKPLLDAPGKTEADKLRAGLAASEREAFDKLDSAGPSHISPAMSVNELHDALTAERDAVMGDYLSGSPGFEFRYLGLRRVLTQIRDGQPVILTFGPRAAERIAAKRAEVKALLGEHEKLGTEPPKKGAKPRAPRKPKTSADGRAGKPPPPPPGQRGAADLPNGDRAGRPVPVRPSGNEMPRIPGPPTALDVRRARYENSRRAIWTGAGYLIVLTVLAAVALGASFVPVAGGVLGTIFAVLSSWLTYRAIAAIAFLLVVLQLVRLLPSSEDGIPLPPLDAWLPALLGLPLLVFAVGPDSIAAAVSHLLNTPVDSGWAHALAAMFGVGLVGVFLVRWHNRFPPTMPPMQVQLKPPGHGGFTLDQYEEEEAFGTSSIGGDELGQLDNTMKGNRGFDPPRFRD